MENKMQIFEHEMFGRVRTFAIDGEVVFVARDVCNAFDEKNAVRCIQRVDDDDKRNVEVVDSMGRKQTAIAVTEPGLYSLLFTMQPRKARKNGVSNEYPIHINKRIEKLDAFKRWVTHDVLPTIRKTGGYVNNSELFVDTYFPALSSDQKVLIHGLLENGMRQQALIAEMKPKAEFAEMVQASEGTLSMAEYSKLLYDKESIKIGRNKLCKLFRDNSVFCQDNKPRQEYVERNYFEVVETIKNGKVRTASRITGRGQIWATKKIKEWLA